MLDLFTPMSPDAQLANRAAYRAFLRERDGDADLKERTLSLRERGMQRYEKPLSALRSIDAASFLAQYRKFDPRRPMTREALLLMMLVKTNAAEAYGVQTMYEMAYERAMRVDDDLELLLLIEETYHTRILLSSAVLYGVQIERPYAPPPSLRTLIGMIVYAPEALSRPLIFASEILGLMIFVDVLYASREILKHDPELRDAIEERVMEIMVDEIGHISFNRMAIGPAGVACARRLLPIMAPSLTGAVREMGALGLRLSARGADRATTSPRIPEAVRKAAFIA